MLYVFWGEDGYSLRQAIERIKANAGDESVMMTNIAVFDGHQVTAAELEAACNTMPFLAEKRLIIVNGLLDRFEGSGRGRKKTSKKNKAKEEWEVFAELACNLPEFTELIITGEGVKATNQLLTALMPTGRVTRFPALNQNELREWVTKRVAEAGGSISASAREMLCRFVGNNLWMMSAEVEKLVCYAGGKTIEEDDVQALVSATKEASVFVMVDAILENRAGKAQELFHQLLVDGSVPAQLLVMIARQVRIIYQICELRREKKTKAEIQTALGMTNDFVMNKAREQADKYSLERLKDIYHRLLDTDVAIKTGRYEGELALNIFIAEIGQKDGVKV